MDKDAITPPDGEDDISDINHDTVGADFDWMLGKLNKHLAALKLVRARGKGKLTVGEAVATTLAQAEAYENWCRFGAPGGVIEVWVEDQRVMALHPGDATDLQGVLFEAVGMPKAVVQVVRCADEVADTVVLLNRELRDVLHKGGRCEQRHPNNRHVTLEVKQEGKGQLSFWVGFNQPSEAPASGLSILGRLKGKAAQAGMCMRAQAERLKEALGVPALGSAAGGLVLIVCAGAALSLREQTGTLAAGREAHESAVTSASVASNSVASNSVASNDAPERSDAPDVVKIDGQGGEGAAANLRATNAHVVYKRAPQVRRDVPQLAATRIDVVASKDAPVLQGDNAVALTTLSEPRGASAAAESSPWDAQRLRRLAEVQRVVLKVDAATSLDKEQSNDLLASIKDALKELGIVALTDESENRTADGVMLLRFESDTNMLGAVFATMRDRQGNFLWENHAGCRVMPDESGWSATFADASTRLMSKLLPRSKVASNLGEEKSQPVIGSKFSRPLLCRLPSAQGLVVDTIMYERGEVNNVSGR